MNSLPKAIICAEMCEVEAGVEESPDSLLSLAHGCYSIALVEPYNAADAVRPHWL
jgi:hypothetical protein